MARQTRFDARRISNLAAAAGQDRLHGGDGVMTRLRPSGRVGGYTATPLGHIAAAGLELQMIQANPRYRFTSERAQRTSEKYGAHSISLLAIKPVRGSRHLSGPNLGDGADAAQAAAAQDSTNTTTTQEVSQ
jgi:hypothetical protein